MLHVISTERAAEIAREIAKKTARTETLPLSALPGRVTARPVTCGGPIPSFARSTMDGYAVIANNLFGAGESAPAQLDVAGEIRMGEETLLSLSDGACAKIPTGGMLPENADAVIPVEYTELLPDGLCLAYRPVSPWENTVRPGDDLPAGAALLAAGTRILPAHIGALAAAGVTRAEVYAKPRAGVLSTGAEIVDAALSPPPGKVRDVNTHLLCALLEAYGCETVPLGIAPDDEAALTGTLRDAAARFDLVVLSGGSSAGEKDLTAKVIAALGEVLAHGVAMKPGKPTVIGKIGDTPVFGLPGHPAACYFVAEAVVRPCVEGMAGAPLPRRTAAARLTENVSSNHGREEFLCVRLQNGEATPVYGKSGAVSQLAFSQGYICIPRDAEGLPAGAEVNVTLF